MHVFENIFREFVGDFKYLIMIAMLCAAVYLAFDKKMSKAVPLIIALFVAVWLVGDTAGVFDWILARMQSWGR